MEKTTTSGADDEEKDEKPTNDMDGEFTFYGGEDHEFSLASKIERGQTLWNML